MNDVLWFSHGDLCQLFIVHSVPDSDGNDLCFFILFNGDKTQPMIRVIIISFLYLILSPAVKSSANQKAGRPLHIPQYAKGFI